MVGTWGSGGDRVRLVVASGRSLPLAMCGVAAPVLVIMNCTLPPNSAVSAGASPAHGTCTALFWAQRGAGGNACPPQGAGRAIAAGRIVELAGPVSHHPDQLPDAADRQVL